MERSFSWLNTCRRICKDRERSITNLRLLNFQLSFFERGAPGPVDRKCRFKQTRAPLGIVGLVVLIALILQCQLSALFRNSSVELEYLQSDGRRLDTWIWPTVILVSEPDPWGRLLGWTFFISIRLQRRLRKADSMTGKHKHPSPNILRADTARGAQ